MPLMLTNVFDQTMGCYRLDSNSMDVCSFKSQFVYRYKYNTKKGNVYLVLTQLPVYFYQ